MSRCYDTQAKAYKNYGRRGIYVCDEWHAYANFNRDIGECPGPGMSMDRIDNDGPYAPWNVRWADTTTQANNRRSSRKVEHLGLTETVAYWARHLGMDYHLLASRIRKGMTVEEAISTPVRSNDGVWEIDGKVYDVTPVLSSGVSRQTLKYRLKTGMNLTDAASKPTVTHLEHEGDRRTLTEWCEIKSIPSSTLSQRLASGWSVTDALDTPSYRPDSFTIDGVTMTATEWAKAHGLSSSLVRKRIYAGWTIERALAEPPRRHSRPCKQATS